MEAKLAKIYYSPQGYWKGTPAIKKLAVVNQTGNLADQSSCSSIRSSPKI